uniref:Uncharacterized protein n=1 Tax=Anguilla anguilla TaxID=7936 RepID=A0A0E9P779_ANGAN
MMCMYGDCSPHPVKFTSGSWRVFFGANFHLSCHIRFFHKSLLRT